MPSHIHRTAAKGADDTDDVAHRPHLGPFLSYAIPRGPCNAPEKCGAPGGPGCGVVGALRVGRGEGASPKRNVHRRHVGVRAAVPLCTAGGVWVLPLVPLTPPPPREPPPPSILWGCDAPEVRCVCPHKGRCASCIGLTHTRCFGRVWAGVALRWWCRGVGCSGGSVDRWGGAGGQQQPDAPHAHGNTARAGGGRPEGGGEWGRKDRRTTPATTSTTPRTPPTGPCYRGNDTTDRTAAADRTQRPDATCGGTSG